MSTFLRRSVEGRRPSLPAPLLILAAEMMNPSSSCGGVDVMWTDQKNETIPKTRGGRSNRHCRWFMLCHKSEDANGARLPASILKTPALANHRLVSFHTMPFISNNQIQCMHCRYGSSHMMARRESSRVESSRVESVESSQSEVGLTSPTGEVRSPGRMIPPRGWIPPHASAPSCAAAALPGQKIPAHASAP